ncbi:hypothetical protein P3X46_017684 [Hevea brasiliensis]|uniref:Leucine-rich repeat-containing N-terminal plant-type domain-containing protein n=1 Tax=Hevea brasiliensis TaxID=3981 RepID=A0ABQ9LQF3_HEVBR|nr:hypothetical protein P3X46_017684 [Hevea brasiliensis]
MSYKLSTYEPSISPVFCRCGICLGCYTISLGICYGNFNSCCSPSEREALLKFQHELIDPLNRLSSWGGKEDCCRWFGVISHNLTGHVIELHLGSLSHEGYYEEADKEYYMKPTFSGKISPSLLNLKHLRYLDLSNNDFGRTQIPKFIGSMESLKYLNLSDAGFLGMIPHELGNLSNLHYLNLNAQNQFQGPIPKDFQNMTSLQKLDLSSNYFNSSLPKWFFHLGNLVSVNLASNSFEGPISIEPQNITSLKELDLSRNYLNSSIPNWLYNCSHLELLDLAHNSLQGKISSAIAGLTSLTNLDLSTNKELELDGGIPRSFKNLCNLRFLSLSGKNQVKGMINLNLDNNLLSGEIPDCWMNWPELWFLTLNNNNLSEIPLSLQNCSKLTTLDIGENELIGHIPAWIGERLSNLVILNFRANKFHGHIPKELCHLASLQILDLSHNNLSGIFPSCIKNFSSMTKIDSVAQVFNVSSGYLYFGDDALIVMKGRMVEYEKILKFVKSIDLSDNNLSGEIPKEITSLLSLQSLNLLDNLFFGKIPDDIGDMKMIEVLDFSQNQLFGGIPQSIANLTFLNLLNLSNNNLSGRIPTSTQLLTFSSSSFVGNKGLCGPPVSENCSENGVILNNGKDEEKGKGDGAEVDWFYVSMVLGFIVGFWSVLGPLAINRRWRYVYFHFLDYLGHKIWWSLR